MSMIDLTASDGHRLAAYENRPESATSSVVVIQEIFGVNAHIRSVVNRYADAGFHAVAPALFDRVERGVELAYDEAGIEAGRGYATQIGWDQALLDARAALDHVGPTGPAGIVGYCYGGSLAWSAAAHLPVAAAVGYYGGRIADLLDDVPIAPVMLHFGELDHAIPLERVAAIRATYPDVPVHVYEGAEHGFNCDARGSFNASAAAQARERTLAFLAEHLGAGRDG